MYFFDHFYQFTHFCYKLLNDRNYNSKLGLQIHLEENLQPNKITIL